MESDGYGIRSHIHVKSPRIVRTSNTTDLETRTDLCRELSLCATENDIQELLVRWHRWDLIKR
jgi:hypothetical protein